MFLVICRRDSVSTGYSGGLSRVGAKGHTRSRRRARLEAHFAWHGTRSIRRMDAWPVLGISIAVLLGLDLFLHRSARETSRTAAIAWSAVWVLAGLGFGVYVWATLGKSAFHQYIAAYAIEKSLSLDNLFVFLIVFKTLGIEHEQQHTVLAWGVLGALVFRGLFVFLGVAALERWDWVSWGLGAILVWAAVRTFREDPDEEKDSRIVRFLSKHLPIARKTAATKFFVKRSGRWLATPLLVAVIGLELTDIVFATDSVPAALSVSRDRFVVYSSNVCRFGTPGAVSRIGANPRAPSIPALRTRWRARLCGVQAIRLGLGRDPSFTFHRRDRRRARRGGRCQPAGR